MAPKPVLDEREATERLRSFFREKPLVVFGSGMSCALDERYGMAALREALCADVPARATLDCQRAQWESVHEALEHGSDLESALDSITDQQLLEAFEYCGWRIPSLHPWLIAVPDVRGIWEGKLTTQWVDPKSGNRLDPIQAYLVVRQTYSRINIRVLTAESSSMLLAGQFSREADGEVVLTGTYRNTPRLEHRKRSPIHYGGLLLRIPSRAARPRRLRGQYWTDRQTLGELSFDWVSKGVVSDFDTAQAIAGQEAMEA